MFKKGSESDTSEGNHDAKDSKEYVRAPYDGLGLSDFITLIFSIAKVG